MKRTFFAITVAAAMVISMAACNGNTDTTTSTSETTDTMNNAMSADKMQGDAMASSEAGVMVGGANMVPSKNIVENAAGSADHTTLVAAVKAAGLAETLSGTGPFTVFAPTNEAFNRLPAGTVDKLLKPEMKGDLTSILTYHVVPGSLRAADLKDGQKLKTVQGKELTVSIKDGKVMIDGANVTIADVISSNGVTHVIDAVLMPKK
ncbi:MAG: fasciclin domain-containing protein [Ferruginibacter sp.]